MRFIFPQQRNSISYRIGFMDSSVNTVRGKKNNVLVLPGGPGLKTFFLPMFFVVNL